MECKELLDKIVSAYAGILQQNLVGIYVHGSLAFGCFRWEKSDVDFLVVVREEPSLEQKVQLVKTLLDLEPVSPPKGVEMSVVLERDCQAFTYPTPFVLHFSEFHKERCRENPESYCASMHGTDYDLAAHFTVTKAVGLCIYGREIGDVFGDVPPAYYLDSIRRDIADAPEDVLQNPVYVILNLCRVYAYMQEGMVLSKADGGEWGLRNLPLEYAPVIQAAAESYQHETPFSADSAQLQRFAREMRQRIFAPQEESK